MANTVNTLLVTGTETGVGKTIALSALAAYWQIHHAQRRIGIMTLADLDGYHGKFYGDRLLSPSVEHLSPCMTNTLLPALHRDGRGIDLALLWQHLTQLQQTYDWVLLEGAGGLGCPLTPETTMADLAWDWRLPTVLVVPVRPGAIAHAVANVALARQAKVHLRGIILTCDQPDAADHQDEWVPVGLLRSLTQVPILGQLPYLDILNTQTLAQAAAGLSLESIFPSAAMATVGHA